MRKCGIIGSGTPYHQHWISGKRGCSEQLSSCFSEMLEQCTCHLIKVPIMTKIKSTIFLRLKNIYKVNVRHCEVSYQ